MAKTLLAILLLFAVSITFSQPFTLSGRAIDKKDTSALIGVNVVLKNPGDTTYNNGASTDINGNFTIEKIDPGTYQLELTYIGYKTIQQKITILSDTALAAFEMQDESKLLKEVTIQGKQVQAQQIGDTAQYNASAFKTNKDASAEDLVTKMPGIMNDNGTLKAQGEQIQKVLIDGKAFFGDDPNLALKNLPAEVIDKIQVFDKLSDQSQFTGFNDGNTQKTLNIITKNGLSNSKFGKIYAGYGYNNVYTAGGNFNAFKGDRRVSIIAMSNNINEQNFSMQDLVSMSPTPGGGNPFRGGGRGRNNPGSPNNFLNGNTNGIATTHAIGLNYSDVWGKQNKVKFAASYFFNASKTNTNSSTQRDYITDADSGLVYNENNSTLTKNFNDRWNGRIEYMIDSSNILTFTPSASVQNITTNPSLLANTLNNENNTVNQTNNTQYNKKRGINFSNEILYQHRFKKKGRTISSNLATSANIINSHGSLFSENDYFDITDSIALTDQSFEQDVKGYTLGGSIRYTEPIKKNSQIEFNVTPSYTNTKTKKLTYDFDSATLDYTAIDSLLSNNFDNTYITTRFGASYRYNKDKLNWMIGLNGQEAMLNSEQTFPQNNTIRKNFFSVLPIAMFNYKFSKTQNLRLFYRTNTNAPSVSQLQNVVDNSNTILLKTGNPRLKQTLQHSVNFNYGKTNSEKSTNFFVFANFTATQDYIGNATYIASTDTVIRNITLAQGTQLTLPVNLDKYMSARSFVTYGFPLSRIKCNMNVNGGFNFTRTPGLVNDDMNLSKNYAFNGGLTLSSNISDKIDFTVSYSANYNIVKNSLQSQNNNNYFNHTASAKFNWQFWKGFVANTNIINSLYRGLSSYNTSYWLWNASLAYKFLKSENLELKFSVNDILNQNTAVSRNVTETYIEDNRYNVLQRYYMATLTYTLRKFGTQTAQKPKDFSPPPDSPGPGGTPPPPPGQ